jgi:hypothetical protein
MARNPWKERSMTRRILICCALALVVAALVLPGAALAKKKKVYWREHAVSFTCGANAEDMDRVAPGDYAVSVELHNLGDSDVTLIQSLALTFPPGGLMAGEVSEAREDLLPGGAALQVSCAELMGSDFNFLGGAPASPYIQGVLMIESSASISVTRTQTASGGPGQVSVDVERIPSRTVSRKVLVCHNPGGPHTISIAGAAMKAHLNHGDSLGACP